MGRCSMVLPVLVVVCLVVGEWWRGQPGPEPVTPVAQALPCVVETPVGLEARFCEDPRLAGAVAEERMRWALGLPVCWWTADGEGLASISGVGVRLAERLAEHRDAGGVPEASALEGVRGVGPALARSIEGGVATRCGAGR